LLQDQVLRGEGADRPEGAEGDEDPPDGDLPSGGPVRDRLGDVPDRPHDVQFRHAERGDPDRRHRDEESDREARQQVRDGPREHEPAAESSLEDLREAPQDDARDEEASEHADDGGEERVQEPLGDEALDEVLPPHAEGARATPISPFRSSASMTKMLTISRMPAMIVKKLR